MPLETGKVKNGKCDVCLTYIFTYSIVKVEVQDDCN